MLSTQEFFGFTKLFGWREIWLYGVFVDLQKAFNTVDHKILCHKGTLERGIANK